jgi:hypothetical protein
MLYLAALHAAAFLALAWRASVATDTHVAEHKEAGVSRGTG